MLGILVALWSLRTQKVWVKLVRWMFDAGSVRPMDLVLDPLVVLDPLL